MNILQIEASNPEISTWVSASAGTGKTKILTDRVLRLFLQGCPPNKILCLTFTNAAASEMRERVTSSLAKWSGLSEAGLKEELSKTLGRPPARGELTRARNLYSAYLSLEEKINIQTIHSFCQKLLKKFPLEAGISPSFRIIDETKSYFILQQIKKTLLYKEDLAPIHEYLTANFHEMIIDEILSEIVGQRDKFLNLDIDNIHEKSLQIISELQKDFDQHYSAILRHQIVQDIVGFDVSVPELKSFFLTASGQKKKRIVPQKIAKPGSNLYSDLEHIQHETHQIDQANRSHQLEHHSKLLSLLGASILRTYAEFKSNKGLLDYDDLIIYASKLLKSSDAKEWVLYKLDGGINHLLVDEAQDTSSTQWQIIDAMIGEFYAGESGREENRTVFVVGDEKQSIFSFQGADVASFAHMNKLLKHKMTSGGKEFKDINLSISYRSAAEIIESVHHVFSYIKNHMPDNFHPHLPKIEAFRTKHSGSVELWPICKTNEVPESFWPIELSEESKATSSHALAGKIADYIEKQIQSGRILPSTGAPVAYGDFMILFRKRDEFTQEVIRALKNKKLEVSGLDRISLRENLAVRDLLAVAKFVINTHDDLNLASLLKSPLIGISEEELYDIATKRGENSIWEYIQNKLADNNSSSDNSSNIFTKLSVFIDLFDQSNLNNFFQHIVDILDYRETLNAHCGADSNDAIDELLYASRNFAREHGTSLQSFIFWLENIDTSIKRDSASLNKIRIMTLHASKGLQAPFVILCDTTGTPVNSDRFLLGVDGKTLSSAKSSSEPDYYKELKALKQSKAYGEYLRLLYVGMTRAEDHLVICGYQGSKKLPENCWYELARQAMQDFAQLSEDGRLIYGTEEAAARLDDSALKQASGVEFFYNRKQVLAQKENVIPKESDYHKPDYSPLSKKDPMGYGLAFHKILEDSIKIADPGSMRSHPLIKTLDAKPQKRIKSSIEKILANQEFMQLIQQDAKTEIGIGTRADGALKIGRIDLIVTRAQEVIIVDYKSDLLPPAADKPVPENYYNQLLFYRETMQKIYPNKQIRTMILWLENGKLRELEDAQAT
ncbi:MAG: AAA family ATPase [Rickettsiales bacterium]|nr:MAG: AAA family ATPase [Rickettsiales bacterium]